MSDNPFLSPIQPSAALPQRPYSSPGSLHTPILDTYPERRIKSAWFSEIGQVNGYTKVTGHSAWFPLLTLQANTIGPFALVGADFKMQPTDSAGTATAQGGGTVIPWGDQRGMTAWIVLAKNLSLPNGEWSNYPASLPGIEAGGVPASYRNPSSGDGYVWEEKFPPGLYSAANVPEKEVSVDFLPSKHRFIGNDTLQVALVCRSDHINGFDSESVIVGFAHVLVSILPWSIQSPLA